MALEQEPDQRASFLKSACGDDVGLLQEVESLLARYNIPVLGVGTGPVTGLDGRVVDWATARLSTHCDHGVAW